MHSTYQTTASQLAHTAYPASPVETLNGDRHSALLDHAALQCTMRAQGEAWHSLVVERCPHLFADVPVFISAAQLQQMREVIGAVERMVALPGWQAVTALSHKSEKGQSHAKGVFFGYDFHLNEQGAHLIEINTNAGGGFLSALLLDSQSEAGLPGAAVAEINPGQVFLDMFRNEWRLARGDAPLDTVAIVDEQPEGQYLYAEFLLAKNLFERAGIASYIVDPAVLQARDDGLYLDLPGGGQKIDLVYNRLTDFSLQRHHALRQACLDGRVVLTPNPMHYACYADKRNLARLTDAEGLRSFGANESDIATLQTCVPYTVVVRPEMEEALWAERKQWFFKPNSGYGSKGAYRGEKLTRRVFAEILRGDYVAQKLAAPGERAICVNDAGAAPLKYDVRCYVYDGKIQL
ncbi:MAG: hypothetical protein EPN14_09950, partial [Gallionella sp.]